MSKGSNFEREICKCLSVWWTGGKRDDVFWRSSQSGGRATQRTKKGQKTFGSYGDIAAVDPIGQPLLKMFCIELKRGRSHGCPGDLLDAIPPAGKAPSPFEATLRQAMRGKEESGSMGWMLICRRDRRVPMVYLDWNTGFLFRDWWQGGAREFSLLRVQLYRPVARLRFLAIPLRTFLKVASPRDIVNACIRHKEEVVAVKMNKARNDPGSSHFSGALEK